MISYGSYPGLHEDQEKIIPFEDTIAGEVVKTRQSYLVPNILKEERYKNKEKVEKLGIHSMLAVPIYLHRFSKDVDTQGVLQIYYKEEDKVFTPLEVEVAEMLSKRERLLHLVELEGLDHGFELAHGVSPVLD